MTQAVIILEMGHTRQRQRSVLRCKAAAGRVWLGPVAAQPRFPPNEAPRGLCRPGGGVCPAPFPFPARGPPADLRVTCWPRDAKRARRFSCAIVFTPDFFMCFPDLPEALNLANASPAL